MANETTQLEVRFTQLIGQASSAITEGLGQFVKLEEKRAGRLRAVRDRLNNHPTTSKPQATRLNQSIIAAGVLNGQLQTLERRWKRQNQIKEDSRAVYGRVLGLDGEPIAGVTVKVVKEQDNDSDLPSKKTNKQGDFLIAFSKEQHRDLSGNNEALHLVVEGKDQNRLFESEKLMSFVAGQAEYFQIQLTKKPSARRRNAIVQTAPAPKPAKKTKK